MVGNLVIQERPKDFIGGTQLLTLCPIKRGREDKENYKIKKWTWGQTHVHICIFVILPIPDVCRAIYYLDNILSAILSPYN